MTAKKHDATPANGEEEAKIRAWLTEVSNQNRRVSKSKQKPKPKPLTFEQSRKQLVIRCCIISVVITGLFLDYYRHGLKLETTGLFCSTSLFTLSLPVVFCLCVVSASRFFNNRSVGKQKQLFIILLLPVACAIPSLLKIPKFSDGAVYTLRKLNISDQLVKAVAVELAKPREDPWDLEPDNMKEILEKDPFSRLGLTTARLQFCESSLVFDFGNRIEDRWGFSISGVNNKSPSIPSYGSNPKMVSKEILVYTGPSD